ncbi:Tip elongation aberrant protein Tea4 [Paramyrothecium foliicola]|nr:Tip elongation aberrant protein Tea4 [Paramyrothecium foliicola]
MTRPSIIRADTIDLQDHHAPSASKHSAAAPASPSFAPHQAETLREVAQETAVEEARSPRLSLNNGSSNGDIHQYAEDLANGVNKSINGSAMQNKDEEDALAIAQNGGVSSSDEGDMDGDGDMDDDMMDKISSSPSIEDVARKSRTMKPPTPTLVRDIIFFAVSIPSPDASTEGPTAAIDENFIKDLRHLLFASNEVDETSTEPILPSEDSLNSLLIPYEGSEDDDDPDVPFPDDPRFIGSGWDSKCLQDAEEIDFEFVYALHTFVATVEGQANATKGDTMVLLDDSNSYWWLVRVVKDSSIGYLPAEHIETPTERLARLNKHRNVDLSATMLGDQTIKPRNPFIPGIRRKRKTVTFTDPTYVDYPEVDYSSEEEEDIDELLGKGPAAAQQGDLQKTEEEQKQQQQTQTQDAKSDSEQERSKVQQDSIEDVKNDIKIQPLATRPKKEVEISEPVQEETAEELERERTQDRNDIAIDSRLEAPSKSRNGNIRNTDSFFRDETVETKKITLTPNLLRDDNATQAANDTGNRDIKSRTSLDKMEKELMSDKDRKKSREKEKREKEKKPSAIRNFFSRKDKKKSTDDDDESFGKRSMDTVSEPRDSEDPMSMDQSLDKAGSQKPSGKLQKPQPRMEPALAGKAPTLSGPKPAAVDYTRTNDVSNVPPASMRIVDPDTQETKEVPSNQQAARDLHKDRSASTVAPRDEKPAIAAKSAARSAKPSAELRPQMATQAKARMDLDFSSDEEVDFGPTSANAKPGTRNEASHVPPPQRPAPNPAEDTSERLMRPQLPGAFPDSYQTASTVSSDKTITPLNVNTTATERLSESPVEVSPVSPIHAKPPGLVGDMSSQEDHSLESSPSPELIHGDEVSKDGTSRTTSREEAWDDLKLRAFFDESDHIRDLLVVVYDKTNSATAASDHPIAGTLFREQNAKLAEITTQLDNMLGLFEQQDQLLYTLASPNNSVYIFTMGRTYLVDPAGDVDLILRYPNKELFRKPRALTRSQYLPSGLALLNHKTDAELKSIRHCTPAWVFNLTSPRDTVVDGGVEVDAATIETLSKIHPNMKRGRPNTIKIRVSSQHLIFASSFFKVMLKAPWKESVPNSHGIFEIGASEWNAEALVIVLLAINGRDSLVPKTVSLVTMLEVRAIADYYDCHRATFSHMSRWLRNEEIWPQSYGNDLYSYLYLSWVYSERDIFERMANMLLVESEGPCEAASFDMLADFFLEIDRSRAKYFTKIFDALDALIEELSIEKRCVPECSVLLLGSLLRQMRTLDIGKRRLQAPFRGYSLLGLLRAVESFQTPYVKHTRATRKTHLCVLEKRLEAHWVDIRTQTQVQRFTDRGKGGRLIVMSGVFQRSSWQIKAPWILLLFSLDMAMGASFEFRIASGPCEGTNVFQGCDPTQLGGLCASTPDANKEWCCDPGLSYVARPGTGLRAQKVADKKCVQDGNFINLCHSNFDNPYVNIDKEEALRLKSAASASSTTTSSSSSSSSTSTGTTAESSTSTTSTAEPSAPIEESLSAASSQSTTTSTTSSSSTRSDTSGNNLETTGPAASEASGKGGGLGTGAIAGIAVGAVAAVAVFGLLAFFLIRQRRKGQRLQSQLDSLQVPAQEHQIYFVAEKDASPPRPHELSSVSRPTVTRQGLDSIIGVGIQSTAADVTLEEVFQFFEPSGYIVLSPFVVDNCWAFESWLTGGTSYWQQMAVFTLWLKCKSLIECCSMFDFLAQHLDFAHSLHWLWTLPRPFAPSPLHDHPDTMALQTPPSFSLDSSGDVEIVLRRPNSQKYIWGSHEPAKTTTPPTQTPQVPQGSPLPTVEVLVYTMAGLENLAPTDSSGCVHVIRMLVSSHRLRLASPVFKAMLEGEWAESRKNNQGHYEIVTTDWNGQALLIVLGCMHDKDWHVSVPLDVGLLAKIAAIVDYYDCCHVIKGRITEWVAKLGNLPQFYGSVSTMYLSVFWVFAIQEKFEEMAYLALLHCEGPPETMGLAIPESLVAAIDRKRIMFIEQIFNVVDSICEGLVTRPDTCTSDCSAALLGSFMRQLHQKKLAPSNRPSKPYPASRNSRSTFIMKQSLLVLDPDGDVELVLLEPNSQEPRSSENRQQKPAVKAVKVKISKFAPKGRTGTKATAVSNGATSQTPTLSADKDSVPKITAINDLSKLKPTWEDGTPKEVQLRVSSRHLMLASPVFRQMLTGPWRESADRPNGLRRVEVREWNAKALLLVLDIIHGHYDTLPSDVALDTLGKIAAIADYYRCQEMTKPFVSRWYQANPNFPPPKSEVDRMVNLCISTVYSWDLRTEETAHVIFLKSDKPPETMGLPIPTALLTKIGESRIEFIERIFIAVDELCSLEADDTCTFECDSFMFGMLTRQMDQEGLLETNRAKPPYDGYSVSKLLVLVQSFSSPMWKFPDCEETLAPKTGVLGHRLCEALAVIIEESEAVKFMDTEKGDKKDKASPAKRRKV